MQLSNRSYYPALDGLRGLAILLVVIYHNFGFINYFFFGWLGVDLFFVLSGFLITDILLKTQNDPNYLKNFFGRRLVRIFPLYYLALILFLLVIPAMPNLRQPVNYYQQNQIWLWLYLQNWLYIFKPPPGNNLYLNHLWSLAVEEQFYLLWPFIIIWLKKPRFLLYIMSGLLLSVVLFRIIIWSLQIEHLAYFNLYTFSRIDGICIGSIVALLQPINKEIITRKLPIIVLTLALLNFLFYFINRTYHFCFPFLSFVGYTTFAVLFGIAVNEIINGKNNFINKVLSTKLPGFFGRISYGLYIFHWPVYLIFRQLYLDWNTYIVAFSSFLLAILISIFSYYFFEKPFLRLKKHFVYTTPS